MTNIMLSPTDIASLTVTLVILMIALGIILFSYASVDKKKFKHVIGWAVFVNISLLIWAIFHVFLDIRLFPDEIVDFLHYWVTHSFIVVAAIGLIIAVRLLVTAINEK